MADDVLSYSDLIRPDNAIDNLIRDLESLGITYSALTQQVKRAAAEIQNTLRTASSVTATGKAQIEQAVAAANTLYDAYNSLKRQTTELGKAEEYFAQKSSEVARETKNVYQQTNAATNSYNTLNSKLKSLVEQFRALGAAERDDYTIGGVLVKQILDLEKELSGINDRLNVNKSILATVPGSYDELTMKLSNLTAQYKALSEIARNDPSQGGTLLAQMKLVAQEIQTIEATMKSAMASAGSSPITVDPTSIDGMKQRVAELTAQYYALSESERQDISIGGALEVQIKNTNAAIAIATENLKNKSAATRSAKTTAEKLNDAMAEYARIMSSIDSTDRNRLSTSDRLTTDKGALDAYNAAIREQLKIKKLEAAAAASADGSYRQLSFTYQALTLKIRTMSTADAASVELKKKLIQEAAVLRAELKKQEEELGNYHRSVGNYGLAWNGLNHEVNQLIRELPNAGISARTFFMAISNNVPMFVEQLQRARAEYKALVAAGQEAVPVYKQIIKGLLSWQTAIVLVLTAMNVWGKDIVDWIESLIQGKKHVQSLNQAMAEIGKTMIKNIDTYGKNIVSYKNLSAEWKNLKTLSEKNQWIKDNQSAFKSLDISVRGVADAERIFVQYTNTVIEALKLRAKAAAAQELAMERYKQSLQKEFESTAPASNDFWDRVKRGAGMLFSWTWDTNKYIANQKAEATEEAKRLNAEAEQFFNIGQDELKRAQELLKSHGIEEYHKYDKERTSRSRDNENSLYKRYLDIQKKYEASITELERDEHVKRVKQTLDASAAKIRALENTYRENEKILAGQDKRYAKLTAEQRRMVEEMQEWITETITNYTEELNYNLEQLDKDAQLNELKIIRETTELRLASIREGSKEEYDLRLSLIKNARDAELIANSKLYEKERKSEIDIISKYNLQIEKLEREHRIKILNAAKTDYDMQLSLVKENSDEELALKLAQLTLEEEIAVEENRNLAKNLQIQEDLIRASYVRRRALLRGSIVLNQFDSTQSAEAAEFKAKPRSKVAETRFNLTQERARWQKQLDLANSGQLDWDPNQFRIAAAEIKRLDNEIADTGIISQIGENGLFGGLLGAIGFDDRQIQALESMTNTIVDQIKTIMQAEIEAAETAVRLAQERVDAAQSAYDAELQARANGYANSVATAKMELEQEKKKQREKQKILEAAQRKQEALDAIAQMSSLVTASANIWSSFSKLGPAGPFLAGAAIATMWASFLAAKIKARQMTSQADTYGEGGLEFLEGGSHASGNDINLNTKNSRGRNMRAEGGEALAIINKRKTRKYRKVLPDIIDSLNKGIFEDKYLHAFDIKDGIALSINKNYANTDLSKLESDVHNIRKNNEVKYYSLSNGNTVIINKNVKRIIKN